MTFFLFRSLLNVLFCHGILWFNGEITAAEASTAETIQSTAFPTTTESTPPPVSAQSSPLPTASESTSLTRTIQSLSLPTTSELSFYPMTTASTSFPTTFVLSSIPATTKSPSHPTSTESTTFPATTPLASLPKNTDRTSLLTTTLSLVTSLPTKHKRSETTTNREDDSGESKQSTSGNNFIVYGVVVFLCVVVLVLALLFILKRKGNFILTCVKGNKTEAGAEDTEMNQYASVGEIILSFSDDDSPGDKNLPGQSTNEKQESPLYHVLEGPYSAPEKDDCQNVNQSKAIYDYPSVNNGCVIDDEISFPNTPGNFEVSFLEEIYTTLNADRGNEEGNMYESLRDENTLNERSDSWSIRGMQSPDQDYVSIVSEALK